MALPAGARLWIPLVVLAGTAAVYAPVVGYEFVCDDHQQVVLSQPYFAWRLVPHYFISVGPPHGGTV